MPEIKGSELKLNSLAVKRPDLVELLVNKDDAVLTCGSGKKVRWWCENGKGHWFESRVFDRSRGHGCSYCSGQKVLSGFNDLSTVRPDISQHFNVEQTRIYSEQYPEKKWALSPEKVSVGSKGWAVWNCENGERHWFEMTVLDRGRFGCAVCAGRQVFPGFNDLASQRTDIAQYFNIEKTREYTEQHPEKKWALSTKKVTVGSDLRAVWDCENGGGHWFEMSVARRSTGQGCAVCVGHQVFSGYNDLAFLRPDVAVLWDYQRNADKNKENKRHPRTPKEVTVSSNRICLWICPECGDVFERKVQNLTKTGATLLCLSCSESQGEKELYDYIAYLLPEDIKAQRNDRTVLEPNELDIYIPELRLAFEFNGDYWHSDEMVCKNKGVSAEEWHGWKLTECANQGIDLFFVWESDWGESRKRDTIEKCVKEIVSIKVNRKKLVESYFLLKILSKS